MPMNKKRARSKIVLTRRNPIEPTEEEAFFGRCFRGTAAITVEQFSFTDVSSGRVRKL